MPQERLAMYEFASAPVFVRTGEREKTHLFKGRSAVQRTLPFGNKELAIEIYTEGDYADMVSLASLRSSLETAGLAVKHLDLRFFRASRSFIEKSR